MKNQTEKSGLRARPGFGWGLRCVLVQAFIRGSILIWHLLFTLVLHTYLGNVEVEVWHETSVKELREVRHGKVREIPKRFWLVEVDLIWLVGGHLDRAVGRVVKVGLGLT